MKRITIIGSGLAGSLLGIYLARRGYSIDLYESRPDIRLTQIDRGRSINLALSCRGITGLAGVDLMSEVEKLMVPMRARAIHEEQGGVRYQAFGRHRDEHINAIVRTDLNKLLLDNLEKYPDVHLNFGMKLLELDVYKKQIHFECQDGSIVAKPYQRLIGADGAGSVVREALYKQNLITYDRIYLPHGYKELSISGSSPEQLAREHLHLWPRDSFLLLGNPNRDNSITGSLFLANEGKNSFAELDNEVGVQAFFSRAFPDAWQAMPDLVDEFLHNPTGRMSTIKCSPWNYEEQCLLIGDAAHGLVPFFGQGMNSAFEDCRLLNELLAEYEDDWARVMPAFYKTRKINTDAVAQMSMENYHEIQSDIRSPQFNLKKQLEQALMHHYPDRYISKHVLVMFTNTPYAEALARGKIQSDLLNEICKVTTSVETINWEYVDGLMSKYEKIMTIN